MTEPTPEPVTEQVAADPEPGSEPATGAFEPGRAAVAGPGDRLPTAEYPEISYPPVAPTVAVGGPGDLAPAAAPAVADARRRGGAVPALARAAFWTAGVVALLLVAALGTRAVGLWPDFGNPFDERTSDRSQPVLLRSIQDLSRFVAAEGNFEVVVDMQDNRKYLPDFLVNERTLFVAAGSVEAYVDFAQIGQGAIVESGDHRTVEITLPAPRLGSANLNHDRSYVFAQQRGLANRVGDLFSNDPNKLQDLYRLAADKISAAARDSGLAKRAEENTRKTLDGMLHSLGYQTINITFQAA